MARCWAALLVAGVALGVGPAAAVAAEPSAAPPDSVSPFEQVPIPAPSGHPHRGAYLCIGSGVALIAASFVLANEADNTYDRYLAADTPSEIDRLYDETTRYDRLSTGTLLTGEALLATGIYLRFLHRPAQRLQVGWTRGGCALSYRF